MASDSFNLLCNEAKHSFDQKNLQQEHPLASPGSMQLVMADSTKQMKRSVHMLHILSLLGSV